MAQIFSLAMSESAAHSVKVTFEPVTEAEMEALLAEDERLNELFADCSMLEYDGFERGRLDFVMYFYGADADRMAAAIVPELSHLPLCDRGMLVKRYGKSRAREETVRLK